MSLNKVQSGQPMRIKADTFNSMIDATRAYKERQQSGGRHANRENSDSNIVLVKNDSGVDAEQFHVLGIDGPIILPSENLSEFENRVTFACSTPTAGTHEGKFVVLAEPIKAGAIGKAYVAGVAVAWVYMEHDGQVLTRVDIRDGQTKLCPAENGAATVLWYEPKTPGVWGDTRAIVRFGGAGAADICVQITATETNGGVYSQWREVELADDDGLSWSPVADGLSGEDDGAIFEVNGVEGIPVGSVVKIFPNPTKDSDPDLPAWLFCYTAGTDNIGYGKPVSGQADAPVTNPYITLTVTDAAGVPILDDEENEQTIKVWRNAARTNLYTRFDAGTVFTYVRFPQPVGGVGGCIFSRTEPIQRYDLYKPADGYSVSGNEGVTPSTDITGNPADEDHLHVRGMMYVEAGSKAFRPWFVIDPEKIVANGGKVKTDEDDTMPGYLDDEIIVLPDSGHNWITKTVTPGGEDDNQLLLEHNDWDAANTSTIGSLISIEDAGPGITITPTGTLPPEGTAWFLFREYEDEYDGKNHSKLRAKEGLKYFIIDLPNTNQVKTNFDDTTAGFLNDEIIVTPASGNAWLTKTVTPGGENDNKLLIEHDEWNDSRISSTTKVVDIASVGGGVTLTSNVPPGNRSYIKFEGWNVSRDPAGHCKLAGTTDYYAYWTGLPEPTAEGDMIYASLGTTLQWSVVNRGQSQSLLYINGFKPEWLPKGNNESILTTQGGNLSWFEAGQDDSILATVSGSLTWYAKGDNESILLTRAGSFHWLPSGLDQSLMYVNGTQVDWFGNPSHDAVLINSTAAGGLAWFPKGDDESIYITRNGEFNWLSPGDDDSLLHMASGQLAWFDSSLLPAVLTSNESGLAWAVAGDDESIFITRGGSFEWLAKGDIGSLLYVNTSNALAWLPRGEEQSLLHVDDNVPTWKPKGADESIFITRGGNLDWLSKGGEKAILYVSGGNLSWLAGPTSATQVLGGGPGWTGNMQWITVVTDVRWNSTSHQLEKKTRSIRVVDAGAESGWTDFATAVEGCSV